MWLLLAFLSATLLGFYDVFKKYLMFLLLVGNSINISLSSHSSCYPHGYSGILG